MTLKSKIKNSRTLKKIALWLLMPSGQARPRLWVKKFVNPFYHSKGKQTCIRSCTRMDVLPFNGFTIGNNSTIEDFCTVNNGVGDVTIGDRTRIGIGSVLIGPVSIGNDVRLAQNVVISGLNHNYEDVKIPISDQGVTTNAVTVNDETWIGANCVILPGVSIGKHCVVAAGSIVTKNVDSYTVVAGNPAKPVKNYNHQTQLWERI